MLGNCLAPDCHAVEQPQVLAVRLRFPHPHLLLKRPAVRVTELWFWVWEKARFCPMKFLMLHRVLLACLMGGAMSRELTTSCLLH